MTDAPYRLYIGDRTFSSWSLRGWLMLARFNLPFRTTIVDLYSGTMAADLAGVAPARTVPAMQTPEGHVLTDSIAIAETLAERHPNLCLWPRDGAARALARSIVAEMHSGFGALRGACPMMLAHGWAGFDAPDDVRADLDRIDMLWALARSRHGGGGPWLFGDYSIADAFYAPVAARIATYGLPVSEAGSAYAAAHLHDTRFRQWRAMAMTDAYDPMPYRLPLPQAPWPGPASRTATVANGPSVNTACPCSGDPVTHFMALDGRTYGFESAAYRDMTLHDPEARPVFLAHERSHDAIARAAADAIPESRSLPEFTAVT